MLYTGYGFLLRLNTRLYPVLALRQMVLSKACRRLIVTLMRRYHTDILHLDASGERSTLFRLEDGAPMDGDIQAAASGQDATAQYVTGTGNAADNGSGSNMNVSGEGASGGYHGREYLCL